MKRIIVLFFIALPIIAFSQKTKTIDIARIQFASIHGYVKFDKNNKVIDTTYTLYGQDNRYKQIIEIYTLKRGSLADIYLFIKKCRAFLKEEEPNVSSDLDGVHVSVSTMMGAKYITLWDPQTGSSGYTDLTGMQLNKLMDAILYHCKRYSLKIVVPKESGETSDAIEGKD